VTVASAGQDRIILQPATPGRTELALLSVIELQAPVIPQPSEGEVARQRRRSLRNEVAEAVVLDVIHGGTGAVGHVADAAESILQQPRHAAHGTHSREDFSLIVAPYVACDQGVAAVHLSEDLTVAAIDELPRGGHAADGVVLADALAENVVSEVLAQQQGSAVGGALL